MTERIRVAVVFGGRSSEHAVSCVSAGSILAHLDPERYQVVPVGITQAGAWVLSDGDAKALRFAERALPSVADAPTDLALLPGAELVSVHADSAGELLGTVDVVFPVLHGPYGEDGTLQGLLEMVGVPYVGAGVLASAAGMDKEFAKKLLAADGLPVGDYHVLRQRDTEVPSDVLHRLGLPLFVKPARGGSSIGITRVTDLTELPAAIAAARKWDPKVIIEAAVIGREVEIGVLERPDGTVAASAIAEIEMAADAEHSFYDFETKYLDDRAQYTVPANLTEEQAAVIRDLAVRAFHAFDCQGLSRVDFFQTPDGPVINEVNTMPGFTSTSMYPRMWAESGVDYAELLTVLIDTALARGTGLR
ncbi:D-alanine--D-alanine ligase [Tsukamurella tyrosinosolvens]|uniref:D-alanine--D-alanine ligase n=1 Tax=Tsukamurella tyrosinosolvens TaxID=57704 RepID=A0A1H4Y4Z9_TSUTY|nr:D-alanine--D-alanine ligase family protein [Tsukamurella tyrosinosolvens]KXP00232.1 D-alanine--D-alanine ligase [Tsukamurella tyrosinosolvens]KXP04624.1 D-alanine--D-alanine ligase [Tsukamurella tyrosinosolvens]KZL97876.1 D-alanine--D-alanine ligase [Tsukamurella tyrosinosolvens]MCA4995490.1 D-alanine--D-alanine ligase [Tsukamurella tyrosinosolvens]MEC4613791.1 D-alanine--D-alanine ligase family protein [Tsukamurella tyrosinosolvens]